MNKTPEDIIKVVLINVKTGEEITLVNRVGSCCHFVPENQRIIFDGKEIQLRLDWSDLNSFGDPTLDADFINPLNKKTHTSKA